MGSQAGGEKRYKTVKAVESEKMRKINKKVKKKVRKIKRKTKTACDIFERF